MASMIYFDSNMSKSTNTVVYFDWKTIIIPPLVERRLYCNHLVRSSIRSHFRSKYLSFYWKKWFYIWYMALAWWLVPCLPFPGLPHIYFLFTVRLRIFLVCRNENFRNSYLSFYWKKWFYIWYMALAWWLVPCLTFPGLPHIYFLFTVQLTNEWVGVFLARRSVQHLVYIYICRKCHTQFMLPMEKSVTFTGACVKEIISSINLSFVYKAKEGSHVRINNNHLLTRCKKC